MKAIWSLLIFAAAQMCFAGGDTNIIAMGEWSEPVGLQNDRGHDIGIRGRLMIVPGWEPAYGGPPTREGAMTFVELQNLGLESIDIHFAVTNLNCELSNAAGKAVPKPTGASWSGRGPFLPCWINLPYNSTIRLFINGCYREPLMLYPGGEPWCYWSIPKSDTNIYYLAGTLNIFTHANSAPLFPAEYYQATLAFPKTRIRRDQ